MHEKALVIFPGALGDFICFLPALQSLARERQVDLLARTEYTDLAPETVRTRSLECHEIARLFSSGADRDEELRIFFDSYAMIWSWMGSGQPDFVRHLSILSASRARIFPFRPLAGRAHLVGYYLSCLGETRPEESRAVIALKPEALAWSDGFFRQDPLQGKRILALAPGSGAMKKNWPPEFFRTIAEWWERELGGRAVIILGPVEEERRELEDFSDHKLLVVSGISLAKVAALLSGCDLYLGNDSGVTHLAAALGVETVSLFGPTDPTQWRPRGRSITVITNNVGCAPCTSPAMKVCPHRKCLTTLYPRDVIAVVRGILAKSTTGNRLLDKGGGRDYSSID